MLVSTGGFIEYVLTQGKQAVEKYIDACKQLEFDIIEIPAKFINSLGLQKLMFEAADPQVFAWYIKNYGPEVNLFVDHSQIVQLEALRQGIWGTKSLWGRVLTYKG